MTSTDYYKLLKSQTNTDILNTFKDIVFPIDQKAEQLNINSIDNKNTDKQNVDYTTIKQKINDNHNNNNDNNNDDDLLNDDDSTLNPLSGHDFRQIEMMNENCIIVNFNDIPIAKATKKTCHLLDNLNKGLLHRAFSCFIFDDMGKLLLQKRAKEKITFPLLWTNTCCSHPLATIDNEMGLNRLISNPSNSNSSTNKNEIDLIPDISSNFNSIKNACIRKLDHELGIKSVDLLNKGTFHLLNRIHYMSPCFDKDNLFGEHEIDYIIFFKLNKGEKIDLDINLNEIDDTKWVTNLELKEMFNDKTGKYNFTPWFKIICENYLYNWWENLDNLTIFENDNNIYRMI